MKAAAARRQQSGGLEGPERGAGIRGWLDAQVGALPRLIGTGAARAFAIALGALLVVAGLHIVNALVIEGTLLNASSAWNVPTVASALFFVAAGVAAWRAATDLGAADRKRERRIWLGVAVAMAALAVEALVNLHGTVEKAVGGDLVLLLTPVVLLALLALVVVLVPPIKRLEPPIPLLIATAGLSLLLSQVAATLANVVEEVSGSAGSLLALFEECAEMLAPALVLAAAVYAGALAVGREPGPDGMQGVVRSLPDPVRELGELRGTRAERDFLLGIGFAAVIAGLHVINALFIEGTLLNFSEDWNVPTFASSLLFLAGAASCAYTARGVDGPERTAWWVIAAIVALLGVEAVADFHGRIEQLSETVRVAMLVAVPLLGALALLVLTRPLRALRRPAPLLLATGALVLVASQALAAFTGVSDFQNLARRVFNLFQESGEMLSACFVLAAAAAADPRGESSGNAGGATGPGSPPEPGPPQGSD